MVFSEENLASSVSLREGGTAPGLNERVIRLRIEGKKERMSLDTVWLRWNIITIINFRNIAEVLSLNILDIPMPTAPSLLPFK